VAELLLDDVDRHALGRELGGVGVAQAVRMDALLDPGPWLTKQLVAGHLTYLDWRVLRKLDGLAKRLWVYLESQSFRRSGIGEGTVRLWLAHPCSRRLASPTSTPQVRDEPW
jgi:hypothetical protein